MEYTEEEKEVINYWKKELNNFEYTKELDLKTNNYFGQFEEKINMITGILNLLEKYQKEIEKLKEHLNQYYDGKLFTANQLKAIEREQNKSFIHKDKIRRKIKELKNQKVSIKVGFEKIFEAKMDNAKIIDTLRELLRGE